jgi:hypothetical protein
LFVILDREYLTLFVLINKNVIAIRGNVQYVPGCCMGYVVSLAWANVFGNPKECPLF